MSEIVRLSSQMFSTLKKI